MGIEPTTVLCFRKMQRIKYLSEFGSMNGYDLWSYAAYKGFMSTNGFGERII